MLDKESGIFRAKLFTLKENDFGLGKINSDTVRGIWSSLNLELLYFTNDDDERYSIQAHPQLMRNITIHAADPPLGYPIFASDVLSIL